MNQNKKIYKTERDVQLGGFLINKNIVYACSGNEPVTASYHDF